MKKTISIALYKGSKREELENLLNDFAEEVYGKRMSDVDSFVDNHWAIYLAMCNDKVIGFSSYNLCDYYGLREPTVSNDYLFIAKGYRKSKAMHLLTIQMGEIVRDLNIPIEHYYVEESGSVPFIGRLKGQKLYNAYEFTADEMIKEADRLRDKIFN